MKKTIIFSIFSLAIITTPTLALAQGRQQGQQNGTQQRVQDPALYEDGSANFGDQGVGKATQNLNQVAERTNNPEIGEQVRVMIQSHQQIQTKNKTALQNMSKRNRAMKFLIGPDYRNAGQVRSNVVGLRNDVTRLEKMKDDVSAIDAKDIQVAIDELKTEANNLDTQLEDQLSGFSLFGWLTKRFAN
ncbi:MAG: hypothetical protein ABFQ62_01100 [Patescibacteria group bacterium]